MSIEHIFSGSLDVIPDTYSEKDWLLSENRRIFSTKVSGGCMLTEYTDISDQGSIGSCVANAICDAIEIVDKSGINLSRMFLYWTGRYNPLDKSGASIRTTLDAVRVHGIPPEDAWPYDISKFNQKPTDDVFEEAKRNRRTTFYRVKSERDVISALESGYPVVFGIAVDSRMFGNVGQPEYIFDGSDLTAYNHAMIVVGYRTVNNRIQFRIRNSWGKAWGDSGYCWFTSDYLIGKMNDGWCVSDHTPKESLISSRNLFFGVGTAVCVPIIALLSASNLEPEQRISGIVMFTFVQAFLVYKRWWLSDTLIDMQ